MKRETISQALNGLDDRHIRDTESFSPPVMQGAPERIIPMKRKRILTFALAAALLLALGVTAYAVYDRRLQDLVLSEENESEILLPEEEQGTVEPAEAGLLPTPGPDSLQVEHDPDEPNMISLQGFAGTPEYQATQAWWEFKNNYDTDLSLLHQVGNGPTPWDDTYNKNGYNIYTQEMADTFEAIAAEYKLKPHSGGVHLGYEMPALYERFGRFCNAEDGAGYYYDDGTFQCDFEYEETLIQLRRVMKGTLDLVSLNIVDAEQYEQWAYRTVSGETVLLALGPYKGLILADLDRSFVVLNVLAGTDSGYSTQELQKLADNIDFSLL